MKTLSNEKCRPGANGINKKSLPYNIGQSPIMQVKSRINCIDIFRRHGITARPGKNFSCIFHKDKTPSANIYANGQKWKCHSCGRGGDAIDLQADLSGQGLKETIQTLTGREFPRTQAKTRPQEKPREISLKTGFSDFIKEYDSCSYESICAELWELSTFRPDFQTKERPEAEAAELLRTLYTRKDFLFIGGQTDAKNPERVKSRDEWINFFQTAGKVDFPLFCLNPVRAEGANNANGEKSFRTAGNIAKFKFALSENDKAPLRDQAAFWLKMIQKGFPVRALIFSGNKSLHAIFETDPEDLPDLKKVFSKLGFDSQTFDPARTARLPGHRREDTGNYQSILFLKGA